MYEFKSAPYAHQIKEFEEHRTDPYRATFWVPRTGKTKLTIDTTCSLFEDGLVDGLFVLAPNGVQRSWIDDELPRHVPDRIARKMRAEFYQSSKASTIKHQDKIERLVRYSAGFAVMTMSYEGFMTDRGKAAAKDFLVRHRCLYAADESFRFKGIPGRNKGKLAKQVIASSPFAQYRRILNGTPVANGPLDLYSQIKFLAPDFWAKHHLDSYVEFKNHFGIWKKVRTAGGAEFEMCLGYKRLDYLNEILQPIVSRVTEDDADINLPEKTYSKRYCEMSPEQARVYQDLRDEYMALLDSGEMVSSPLAIVRALRMQQIVSGYVPVDGDEPMHVIPGRNDRLETLMDVVEERRHRGIIWCRFDYDVDMIMAEMKKREIPAVQYDGRIKDDLRAAAKDRFHNGTDDVLWFVSKAQVGGAGLPLHMAKTAIYYSNSFRLIDRLQSEDRALIIGKKTPIEIIDIVCPGTIDEKIVRALREKANVAAEITGDTLKEWL